MLKSNELDGNRKTQIQRNERMEKIKNYNVNFGSKVKNIQCYNNYMDMMDDIVNEKNEKDINNGNRINMQLRSKSKQNLKSSSYNDIPKVQKNLHNEINNLDFNFNQHEQTIKQLEDQINYERKLRTDINMKYFQKVKEWEELKFTILAGEKNKKPLSQKTKKIMKRYSKSVARFNTHRTGTTRFNKQINKSVDIIKRQIPKTRRNSADQINEKIKNVRPEIEKIVDYQINNLYKDVIKDVKNKNIFTIEGRKSNQMLKNRNSKSNLRCKSKPKISKNINTSNNANQINNMNNLPLSPIHQNLHDSEFNEFNSGLSSKNPFESNIYNYRRNNQINNNDRYINMNPTSCQNKIGSNEVLFIKQNISPKIDNMNKFQMINTINKEIDKYNKGIPQLMDKVEKTIQKINKTNLLDDNIHPLIKMASKQAGMSVHLHLEELTEIIIDDLLIECVHELQKIEEENDNKQKIEDMKCYLSNYYQDLKLAQNLEMDVSKKLSSKNYLTHKDILNHNLEKNNMERKQIIYKNPFETEVENLKNNSSLNTRNFNQNLYKNPENFYMRRSYKTAISKELYYSIDKYSKAFYEHLKVTGTFYYPNIFSIYNQVVNELLKECLEDELTFCMRQIDSFVSDIYKTEVMNNDLIK